VAQLSWHNSLALLLLLVALPLSAQDEALDEQFWQLALIDLRERSEKIAAVIPARDALPLNYQRLVVNGELLEFDDYIDLSLGLLAVGAVSAASAGAIFVLHEATGMALADLTPGIAAGAGAAFVFGAKLVFEATADVTEERVIDGAQLALEQRHEQLQLDASLRHTIQAWSLSTTLPFLLERLERLGQAIDEQIEHGRGEVRLIQYAYAKSLLQLAGILSAAHHDQRVDYLHQLVTRQLDAILRYNVDSSIAMTLYGMVDLQRYLQAERLHLSPTERDRHWQRAIAWFEHARHAEPRNHNTTLALANAWLLRGDAAAAHQVVETYLDQDWDYLNSRLRLLNALGDIERYRGDRVAAFRAYRSSSEVRDNITALRWLLDLGSDPEVIEHYPTAVTAAARIAYSQRLLQEVERIDAEQSEHDAYYPWGGYIEQHQSYYEQLLQLAAERYQQQGDRRPLHQAAERLAAFRYLTVNQRDLQPRALAPFRAAAIAANQQTLADRLRWVAAAFSERWIAPLQLSFWSSIALP